MSMSDPIPALIGATVGEYVTGVLADPAAFRGQQLRGGGPVAEFETRLSAITGFPFCLAMSSATTALMVASVALDLPGKRVAVTKDAWEGSLGTLAFSGAELDEVSSFSDLPTGVSAVLAVDRATERHDSASLRVECEQRKILYIEDTGWLPGVTAPLNDRSLADLQVLSFGPGKPLPLGEGGALLCRSLSVYRRAVLLSQHPERAIAEGIDRNIAPVINGRMHPLAALIGTACISIKQEKLLRP